MKVPKLPFLSCAVLALGGVAACNRQGDRTQEGAEGQVVCDSARAARAALDSLARIDPFISAVRRFETDSAGVRIVTGPAEEGRTTDGAAIVRVDRSCRIVSLVQTDSA